MALLWDGKNKSEYSDTKLLTINKNPSPTCLKNLGLFVCLQYRTMEGRSLLAAFHRKVEAGMTVEATIVLPIFMFFVLNLASLMEIVRLHGNLQYAIWDAGNKTALYANGAEDGVAGSVLSAVYIRSQVISLLGEEYLENSPLKNGKAGLLITSVVDDDTLSVTAAYCVEPLSGLVGFRPFWLTNTYYTHLWNGYAIPEVGTEQKLVYVTENGTVYHDERNCTHLALSIRAVDAGSIGTLKNQWGRIYGDCEKCAQGIMPSTVFVTDEGECCHYSKACSGLKRTISVVRLEEAEKKYRSCSRCSAP